MIVDWGMYHVMTYIRALLQINKTMAYRSESMIIPMHDGTSSKNSLLYQWLSYELPLFQSLCYYLISFQSAL